MDVDYEPQLIEILQKNEWFMAVLMAVRLCDPPDWLVGGGVIRNIVWDHLHHYTEPTPVKDVDVAYFDPTHMTSHRDEEIQTELCSIFPEVPWEASNQAAVHLWYERAFGFPVEPLFSSADGIATWPEPATCVGVRLLANGALHVVAPHGLHDLFQMILRRNPRRVTKQIFLDRVRQKTPMEKWPKVTVVYEV